MEGVWLFGRTLMFRRKEPGNESSGRSVRVSTARKFVGNRIVFA